MGGILIAEDEMIERMALKKTLQKHFGEHCEIYEAENGAEALACFRKERIDVAIMDISMPEMNGMDAAAAMRAEDGDFSLIFLTAYDRFDYARRAITVQAVDYLLKPYSRKEILATVEEGLRRARLGRERHGGGIRREREAAAAQDKETENQAGRLSVMVSMIEEYIRIHYMFDISMHDMASAVGYSEPYFCSMFKQQFGQNFTAYLTDYRMKEAKKLLAMPNVNVKEVSSRVGYPNSQYFTRVFKRCVGVSPSEYRSAALRELQDGCG